MTKQGAPSKRKRVRYATDSRVQRLEVEVANLRDALKAWEELFATLRAGIADDELRLCAVEQQMLAQGPYGARTQ